MRFTKSLTLCICSNLAHLPALVRLAKFEEDLRLLFAQVDAEKRGGLRKLIERDRAAVFSSDRSYNFACIAAPRVCMVTESLAKGCQDRLPSWSARRVGSARQNLLLVEPFHLGTRAVVDVPGAAPRLWKELGHTY